MNFNQQKLNINIRRVLFILMYWFIFIVIPGYITFTYKFSRTKFDFPGYILFYILFFAPLLFVIPYKMLKLTNKSEKIFYIFFGVILPYIFIYFYLYISYRRDFNPSF